MNQAPLFDPADFRLPPGIAHVCAAGETPFLHRHDQALLRYAADKSMGPIGRPAQEGQVDEARARAAAMWGVPLDEMGLCASVAEGVGQVVESLDWQPGDNAVMDPDEYPSDVAPLALRRGPAVQLRFASAMDPAAVAAQVDDRTRIIIVSAVSYLTAARPDLAALRAVADRVGALLVVDYTQAAGWAPISAEVADFAFSSCYKWLLGTTGVALAYWNRRRQPGWAPASAGWYSLAGGVAPVSYAEGITLRDDAMRFCRGNPAYAPTYVLNGALAYLAQWPAAAVQAHVQGLTTALLAGLAELGIPSTTPADPARHGASVCVAHPQAAALTDALQARGVWAWNGRGRIRFSFHGYNGAADVARILDGLRAVWPRD